MHLHFAWDPGQNFKGCKKKRKVEEATSHVIDHPQSRPSARLWTAEGQKWSLFFFLFLLHPLQLHEGYLTTWNNTASIKLHHTSSSISWPSSLSSLLSTGSKAYNLRSVSLIYFVPFAAVFYYASYLATRKSWIQWYGSWLLAHGKEDVWLLAHCKEDQGWSTIIEIFLSIDLCVMDFLIPFSGFSNTFNAVTGSNDPLHLHYRSICAPKIGGPKGKRTPNQKVHADNNILKTTQESPTPINSDPDSADALQLARPSHPPPPPRPCRSVPWLFNSSLKS